MAKIKILDAFRKKNSMSTQAPKQTSLGLDATDLPVVQNKGDSLVKRFGRSKFGKGTGIAIGAGALYNPGIVTDVIGGVGDIIGGGVQNWRDLFGQDNIPVDYTSNLELQQNAYNPMQSYDTFADEYARIMTPSGMSSEDMLNLINQYSKSGRVSGGTGRGGRTGNEYFNQYRQSFNTPASSLVPTSGEEQLAAARLRSQGQTLSDYLKLIDAAYNAAGAKSSDKYRTQVANLALSAYLSQQQAQQKMYQDMMKSRLQAQANYGLIPEYQVGENERAQAEQRALESGMTLQDAINELAKQYYYDQILSQSQYLK